MPSLFSRPAPLANPPRRNFCGFNAIAQALRALVAARPSYAAALQRDAASGEHQRASLAKCLLDVTAPVAETVKRLFAPRFSNDVEYDAEEIFGAVVDVLAEFSVLFRGSLLQTATCRAMGHISECSQAFSRLQVKPGKEDTNLVHAMAGIFEPEALVTEAKDFHRCIHCLAANVTLQGSTVATEVECAGEIVALHVARALFAADGTRLTTKNTVRVSVAETLTLAGSDYRLMAAVSHTGLSARTGHFVAHTKNTAGEVYLCDDANVTLMPRGFNSSTVDCDGYLLFYVVSVDALCFVFRLLY
jgi:hypothetical protein